MIGVPLSEAIRIWHHDMAASMSTRTSISSDRNFRMQPVFSMLTNVNKCKQATPPKAPETAPAACSAAFVTWHPSTASTASTQTSKHNQSVRMTETNRETSWKKAPDTANETNGITKNAATIPGGAWDLVDCCVALPGDGIASSSMTSTFQKIPIWFQWISMVTVRRFQNCLCQLSQHSADRLM